jgi:DnaJ family protein C protein 8
LSVIHPDKAKHERAPEAFDLLKKAESELSDKEKRENLDGVIKAARNEILKGLQLPTTVADDHPKLKDSSPPFKEQLRAKSRQMLIDEELRRRR